MTVDKKLMRNGNGWVLCLNSTILGLLDVNPEEDMVQYTVEKDRLIITKSDKKVERKPKLSQFMLIKVNGAKNCTLPFFNGKLKVENGKLF